MLHVHAEHLRLTIGRLLMLKSAKLITHLKRFPLVKMAQAITLQVSGAIAIQCHQAIFPTLEDFETKFIPWLEGKTLATLKGIEVFTNDTYVGGVKKNTTTIAETDLIDFFTGASVTPNNMIRVMKVLLAYHEKTYK